MNAESDAGEAASSVMDPIAMWFSYLNSPTRLHHEILRARLEPWEKATVSIKRIGEEWKIVKKIDMPRVVFDQISHGESLGRIRSILLSRNTRHLQDVIAVKVNVRDWAVSLTTVEHILRDRNAQRRAGGGLLPRIRTGLLEYSVR